MDYWIGVVTLFVALAVVSVWQIGAALGVMFLMFKKIPPEIAGSTYLQFDFDNFQKQPFIELLTRLALIFAGPTLILGMLEYMTIYRHIILHRGLIAFLLFIFEVSAIGAGLFYFLQLDKIRFIILTAASALVYLFFLWYLVFSSHLMI